MPAERRPEPTPEQLQAALDRLHVAAPRIWPQALAELGPNAKKLVRARALQAMGETDLRSREQVAIPCSLPDGSIRTRWVYGQPIAQQVLGPEFKK